MIKTLSRPAVNIINGYLHLPFPGKDVSCPYYNNKRHRVRGALRVLIGKGSVNDIIDEAMILSLKLKVDLKVMTSEELKHFLVDHYIGIDCSGLAYYILNAESLARHLGRLRSHLNFSKTYNPLRSMLRLLRTVENTSVDVLADEKNSRVVLLADVQPGDCIIMKQTGREQTMNHLLIVHEVEYDNANVPTTIHYTHTLHWSTDGKYNHGVRQGVINITDVKKSLLEQSWIEQGKVRDDNETYQHAQAAKVLEIRRLRAFGK